MGLRYKARNSKKYFDVNLSGANMLGLLHAFYKIGSDDYSIATANRLTEFLACSPEKQQYLPVRPPYSATASDAKAMAEQIAALTDDQLMEIELHELNNENRNPEETREESIQWYRSWQEFLYNSGGYNAS